jgi:hypothetical protein
MPPRRTAWVASAIATSLISVGCAQQPDASGGRPTRSVGSVIPGIHDTVSSAPVAKDSAVDERPQLARLEREARALAKRDGCAKASACRTAPMGWRGCGGPRTYLVYCASSTDTVALFAKLAELERAEQDYNARTGIASTCESRTEPGAALNGKRCRDAPSP